MAKLCHLVVTTLAYVAISVCGFLISLPLGLTKTNFGGYCVLFMEVNWENENHFIAEFGDGTACDFAIYLPICACVVHGILMAIYHGYVLCKALTTKNYLIVDTMWVAPWLLINILITIFTLILSCVITAGVSHTCTQLMSGQNPQYESCFDFQEDSDMVWSNPIGERIDTSTFYRNMVAAQISSWTCVGLWLLVVIISVVRVTRGRRSTRTREITISASSSQEKAIIADMSPTA